MTDPTTTRRYSQATAETIAAISGELWSQPERWREAYEAWGPSLGGFPMFYDLAIEMAVALEKEAGKENIEWGVQADWALTVEEYVGNVFYYLERGSAWPTAEVLENIASHSFVE